MDLGADELDDVPQDHAAAARAGDPQRGAARVRALDRRLRDHVLRRRLDDDVPALRLGRRARLGAAAGQRRRQRDLPHRRRGDDRQRALGAPLAAPGRPRSRSPRRCPVPRALPQHGARVTATALDLQQHREGPPVDALHPHGRVRAGGRADHRPRRRLLPRGRERQALPRRARRPVLGQHRLRLRRGDRAGRARADARAAVLHELVVRASARDRARRRGRVARPGRPEPRLLRLRRLGGGRVGVEARAAVLPRARREAAPRARRATPERGHDAIVANLRTPPRRYKAIARQTRVPRHDARRALAHRHPGDPGAVRAARRRGAPRRATRTATTGPTEETEEEFTAVPARRARADDPGDGARDGVPRAHGAGAELRRRLHPARGLLAGRARAVRRVRHPALGRRGDHRASAGSAHWFGVRALRHPARHRHLARRGSRPRTPRSAR